MRESAHFTSMYSHRMEIEGLTAEQVEIYEKALLECVPQTDAIGNRSLRNALQWEEPLFWEIRNRLIERGLLVQGRGRGGSVRRLLVLKTQTSENPNEVGSIRAKEEEAARESDLYSPMADVIKKQWAKDYRLDDLVVEVTAAQGSRQTKGKWTRPDITVATYKTFAYVPGRHFDVITFEIKPHTMLDVTVVYEALGHRRASTRAYCLLHIPDDQSAFFKTVLDEIQIEAKRHGVGVLVAAKPDDYDTWEELVEAVRYEPDPERLNEFLTLQMPQGTREKIIKWFK